MSDIFVSASLSEGLPNSVLEAGTAGLPMILSDIPQHREIWDSESEIVSFFPVKDKEILKEKMEEMINRKRDISLRYKISANISERFNSIRMSKLYQSFYNEMLNN